MKFFLILVTLLIGRAYAVESDQRISNLTKMLEQESYTEHADIETPKGVLSQDDIDYCVSISNIAEIAMKHRQDGKKFEEMYRVDLGNETLTTVARAAVVEVFKMPVFKTTSDKRVAVDRFKDATINGCILEFENNL